MVSHWIFYWIKKKSYWKSNITYYNHWWTIILLFPLVSPLTITNFTNGFSFETWRTSIGFPTSITSWCSRTFRSCRCSDGAEGVRGSCEGSGGSDTCERPPWAALAEWPGRCLRGKNMCVFTINWDILAFKTHLWLDMWLNTIRWTGFERHMKNLISRMVDWAEKMERINWTGWTINGIVSHELWNWNNNSGSPNNPN